MKSIYQDSRNPYETAQLHQICSECLWWQTGHGLEVLRCPLCGAQTDRHLAIEFGGAIVEFDGTHFVFHQGGASISIDRADYPDTISFMLRHAIEGPVVGNLGARRPISTGVGDYHEKHPRMGHTWLRRRYLDRIKSRQQKV